MMTTTLTALAAIALDWLLGEPRRRHPLVGFGYLAGRVEQRLMGDATLAPTERRRRGLWALLLLLLPITAIAAALTALPNIGLPIGILMLYAAIGHKSLHDHARPVALALQDNNTREARRLAGRMVSRDPAALDVAGATTESVLENGNDGVFGALFWYVIAGGAGTVAYRLTNTLDAMWGYRNDRYRDFGRAAARCDDLLNFIPARLTAVTYAIVGKTRPALRCWRSQAAAWDSPNAGPVMAAGAGALGIRLGGPARYSGEWHRRPTLGLGSAPRSADIGRALRLVRRGVWLWLGLLIVAGGLFDA